MPNNYLKKHPLNSFWQQCLIAILFCTGLLLSQTVMASDIGALKEQKIAGEQSNGYVGLIKQDADMEVKSLIDEINAKRKRIYQQLAKKQNISLAEIEHVAGQRNIGKTPNGQLIKDKSGNWVTK